MNYYKFNKWCRENKIFGKQYFGRVLHLPAIYYVYEDRKKWLRKIQRLNVPNVPYMNVYFYYDKNGLNFIGWRRQTEYVFKWEPAHISHSRPYIKHHSGTISPIRNPERSRKYLGCWKRIR